MPSAPKYTRKNRNIALATMRYLVISYDEHTSVPRTYVFSGDMFISDSKFLHLVLCKLNPGPEYSVRFTHEKPRETNKTEFYYGSRDSTFPDFPV